MRTITSYIIHHLPRALALIGGILTLAAAAAAQPAQSVIDELGGTTYLIAFPDTTANAIDIRYPNTRVRPEASIWIYSAVKNKVRIISNNGASTTLTLDPDRFKIYQIPGSAVVEQINTPVAKSFKIQADFPVLVYCYFAHIQGIEAWTPLPVELWGKSYRAAAAPGEVVSEIGIAGETVIPETQKAAPAEILVIAAYDNTTVTLTPPRGTELTGNGAREVKLNAGECYQVQSTVRVVPDSAQQDIGGTRIQANRPIGVISGNTRAQVLRDQVGLKNNAYKNMLIEWLRPDEQQGKEFLYMPTWDNHRPGIGAAAERRREYVRLYATGAATLHGSYIGRDSISQTLGSITFEVRGDTMREFLLTPNAAVHYRTDRPAQAMMHSSAIVQFNGSTPCFRGVPCISYSAWAPYMVTLTPREQWTTFAPYYAPPNPGGMQHYINVVTDTNSAQKIMRENGTAFLLNRKVPGTDLIWGSMSVSQGEDHWLMGKDGARFAGYVYGVFQGGEEYRPGRTRKKDGDPIAQGGGSDEAPAPLHPAEYEEYNANSYGYPLVSMSRILRPSDSVVVDTVRDCSRFTIKLRTLNADPIGFRSVSLDPQTQVNIRIVPVDPVKLSEIVGSSSFEVWVEPIDPLKRASGAVIIRDLSGSTRSIPVVIESDAPAFSSGPEIRFDSVAFNTAAKRTITMTNTRSTPVTIRRIAMAIRGQGFTIVTTDPEGPARTTPDSVTLPPGASMTITLRFGPTVSSVDEYADTVVIATECLRIGLPVTGNAPEPEIVADDLDFGVMRESSPPRTLWVRVCNVGRGWATFFNPNNGPLLEWSDGAFSIPDSALAWLGSLTLGHEECISLPVTFTPQGKGDYQATARFWGNTRSSRDTSVWRARVDGSTGVAGSEGSAGYALETSTNGDLARITYTLAKRAGVRIAIHDGAGALVATLVDDDAGAGTNTILWSAGGYPSGIYFCTITAADWSGSAPIVVVR